ncbi:MAG: cell division protein FtsI/penicillin-binding protein 2 [Bacteroidetes bacterium]|jgi:cell division protein FtsI (penicillin-binding protein 3)|nr:cell division protein FtsI/penicillin-binding protein 2 [Bacteroidota bacterium]
MLVFAIAIVYRIIVVQFVEGDKWREKAKQLTTMYVDIEAARGNIFDVNGNLLATSLPYFEVGMDVNAPSILKDTFNKYATPLAEELANLFKDKDAKEYRKMLQKARNKNDRYIVLHRNVSYRDLQVLKKFPILRKGKRGGLVYVQTNKRERPFKMLASRTIGYTQDKLKVGIEGAYDTTLRGVSGKRLMQKIAADVWRPINDENEIEPKDGNDIYTTIDINIQDVAENALYKALVKNNASHGCAVLMEVKTGEIKAIANLTKTDSGMYSERYNYAMGYASEPGSTFKLASLLVAIDDGYIDLNDEFQVGNGTCQYYDRTMKDSHEPEAPKLSAQRIFEVSSNVGTSQIISKYYSKDPQKFVDKLKTFNLDKPLGLGIQGEGVPRIKNTKSDDWYGTTLPWMSIGYETSITPLQTLTLYNAIANNGSMVKPRFIREIQRNGKTIRKFEPEIINAEIVKPSTVVLAKKMLEGVVEKGSGKGINITAFKVAGKTGTAQIAIGGKSYGTSGNHAYQASFVGYFPADNPLYTCIVIIYNPSAGNYYGGLVAAPVFKEIAEKVYSNSLDFQQEINGRQQMLTKNPELIKTKKEDAEYVLNAFNIKYKNADSEAVWVAKGSDSTSIKLSSSNIEGTLKKGMVPNLYGMSAKDALFLLENNGINVKLQGIGSVKKQSIEAGSRFFKGSLITLILG